MQAYVHPVVPPSQPYMYTVHYCNTLPNQTNHHTQYHMRTNHVNNIFMHTVHAYVRYTPSRTRRSSSRCPAWPGHCWQSLPQTTG